MEFRLIYQGKLPAASSSDSRSREKQIIRKQIHRQLKSLWQEHPALRHKFQIGNGETRSEVGLIATEFARNGYKFVPLIRKKNALACSLEILFLRRDGPGNVVKSGGDIDNRLKVLLDGLRMPEHLSELAGFTPEADEDPFFCLLEDDVLINDISVVTDRLLLPQQDDEKVHDVFLVIWVKTKAVAWHAALNYGF